MQKSRDMLSSDVSEQDKAQQELKEWTQFTYHLQKAIFERSGLSDATFVYRGQTCIPIGI